MKQIKLKSKFRQANSSLRRCNVGRLIRMLLGRADVLASNVILIVLVSLMAIGVCCMRSGKSNQLELTGINRESSDQRNNLNNKQNMLILLSAVRDFCSNNPRECQTDRPLDNCLILGERLVCNQIVSATPARESTSTIDGDDKTGQQSNSEMNRENRTTFPLDELAEGQFWMPKLAPVAGECNVSLQDDQPAQAMKARERILNMLAKYETLEAATEVAAAAPTSRSSWTNMAGLKKVNEKLKRNQEQYSNRAVNGRQAAMSNTYRVTPEQAIRLIRAHRRQQNGLLAPLAGPIMLAASPGGGGGNLLIVPKRTDSVSSSSDEIRPESGIRRATSGENSAAISTKTSGHQLARLDELGLKLTATSRPPELGEVSNNEEALKCNMRRFIYRATKTDRAGNQCTGLITASICYGACDTGEIADWLFPHKKSIHKVCRHGRRVRRETRLTDCTTSSGSVLDDDELDNNLPRYHYVDALDCVCKRCDSADTTCLGTMSTPHLQTLGEIGEIGEIGQSNHNLNRRHQQQQQLMTMTSSGGGD